MGQFELVFAIFAIVMVIYVVVAGIKFLLNKSGKSEKEILKNAKERKETK